MTSFEHAMLGITGSLAAGLDRRFGWPIAALAGVAALLPDWDGLSLALGPAAFERLHRTAGHNLLAAILLGAAAGALDYRYSVICRLVRLAGRWTARFGPPTGVPIRTVFFPIELSVWIATGVVASLSHLAADMVFSGSATLADWGLKLLWPFSGRDWVYPLVRWGDVGTTVIFVLGMFAMLRWRRRLQLIAQLTLAAVVGYIAFRGFSGG